MILPGTTKIIFSFFTINGIHNMQTHFQSSKSNNVLNLEGTKLNNFFSTLEFNLANQCVVEIYCKFEFSRGKFHNVFLLTFCRSVASGASEGTTLYNRTV